MTDKNEKPLFLDLEFGEALRRFAKTDKKESDDLLDRTKQKKKSPETKSPATRPRQRATPPSSSDKRLSDDN